MPFCIYCGKQVGEDALVCPYCGKKLGIAPAPAEKQTTKQASGLREAGLGFGITGIVVMIWAGIGMIPRDAFATAEHFYAGVGIGFVGLGLFFAGILCLLLARTSKS